MGFDIGTTNLGFAAALVNAAGDGDILRAEVVNIKASSTDASVIKLWRHLDEVMCELDEADGDACVTVYIEQQPSKARSVMRSVELGVRYYFLRLSMLPEVKRKIVVKSVSSRTKLCQPVVYAAGATQSQRYRARKKASVDEICGMMSASAPAAWRRICSGKSDDVCDALLYIVRHGCVRRFLDHAPEERVQTPETVQDALQATGSSGADM